jgi:hypothetical protein
MRGALLTTQNPLCGWLRLPHMYHAHNATKLINIA